MTPGEARQFLKVGEGEDLEDAWELALFEIRQFLLSKPVLLKTFQSKQARIVQLREAFKALGGEEPEGAARIPVQFELSESVLQQFTNYHAAKNEIKKQLGLSDSSYVLENGIEALLYLEKMFVRPFSAYDDWTSEEVLISREPDAMLVLSLLREQAANGLTTLADLHKNRNNLPIELTRELKRLSLHKNYLYE